MTYSIIAHDPQTGRTGAAVASCVLAIGSRALWGEPGLGVASVQAGGQHEEFSTIERLLRQCSSADVVIAELATLPSASRTQIGLVDASGRAAARTGIECPSFAEHAVGPAASAQGNLLREEGQAGAMLAAWDQNEDAPIEERLILALLAGEDHGGDSRGRQSAGLLVVPTRVSSDPIDDPDAEVVSLRVDDHRNPIAELQRLVSVNRAHADLRRGLPLAAKDPIAAAQHLRRAQQIAPDDALIAQYAALLFAKIGEQDQALAALDLALSNDPAIASRLLELLDQEPWVESAALRPAIELRRAE